MKGFIKCFMLQLRFELDGKVVTLQRDSWNRVFDESINKYVLNQSFVYRPWD